MTCAESAKRQDESERQTIQGRGGRRRKFCKTRAPRAPDSGSFMLPPSCPSTVSIVSVEAYSCCPLPLDLANVRPTAEKDGARRSDERKR